MSCKPVLLLVVGLLAGCVGSTDNGPRTTAAGWHFSIEELDGWRVDWDRGTVVFHSDTNAKVTIAVRAVSLNDRHFQRTQASFVRATEVVLRALPEAHVAGPSTLTAPMPSNAFEVDFVPVGQSDHVRRRHVVMFGERWVFHVMMTTSADACDPVSTRVFSTVISTLREEA